MDVEEEYQQQQQQLQQQQLLQRQQEQQQAVNGGAPSARAVRLCVCVSVCCMCVCGMRVSDLILWEVHCMDAVHSSQTHNCVCLTLSNHMHSLFHPRRRVTSSYVKCIAWTQCVHSSQTPTLQSMR